MLCDICREGIALKIADLGGHKGFICEDCHEYLRLMIFKRRLKKEVQRLKNG